MTAAFGAAAGDDTREMPDLSFREVAILLPITGAVLWMGLYPKPFTDVMHVSVTELLKHVALSKL